MQNGGQIHYLAQHPNYADAAVFFFLVKNAVLCIICKELSLLNVTQPQQLDNLGIALVVARDPDVIIQIFCAQVNHDTDQMDRITKDRALKSEV